MERRKFRAVKNHPGIFAGTRPDSSSPDRWVVSFRVRGVGQTTRTFLSLSEAKRFPGELHTEQKREELRRHRRGKVPFGEYLVEYLDRHADRWDRFSWFGFQHVLTGSLPDGTRQLGKVPDRLLTESRRTIGDIEALLIQSLGTQHRGNSQEMRFGVARHWTQVMAHEVDTYLGRVG